MIQPAHPPTCPGRAPRHAVIQRAASEQRRDADSVDRRRQPRARRRRARNQRDPKKDRGNERPLVCHTAQARPSWSGTGIAHTNQLSRPRHEGKTSSTSSWLRSASPPHGRDRPLGLPQSAFRRPSRRLRQRAHQRRLWIEAAPPPARGRHERRSLFTHPSRPRRWRSPPRPPEIIHSQDRRHEVPRRTGHPLSIPQPNLLQELGARPSKAGSLWLASATRKGVTALRYEPPPRPSRSKFRAGAPRPESGSGAARAT
jgi:hypothetical protein